MLEERALELGATLATLRLDNEELLHGKMTAEEEVHRLSQEMMEKERDVVITSLALETSRVEHANELGEKERSIRALQSTALSHTAELVELRRLVQELSATGAVMTVQSEAQIATLTGGSTVDGRCTCVDAPSYDKSLLTHDSSSHNTPSHNTPSHNIPPRSEQSKIGHDAMSTLRAQLVDARDSVKRQQDEIVDHKRTMSELTHAQSELTHQLHHTRQALDALQRHSEEVDRNHIQQLADCDGRLTEERQALALVRSQCRDQQTTIREMEEQHIQDDLQLSSLPAKCLAADRELIEKRNEITALRASLVDKEVTLKTSQHTLYSQNTHF